MSQRILVGEDQYDELDKWLSDKRVLVVCGSGYHCIKRTKEIVDSHENIVYFHHYKPNPVYESVVEGVDLFKQKKCDAVMAVGGGSAMDVAKCIKLFNNMDRSRNFLEQVPVPNDIPFLAVPTTAGTGSEATRYAVIYLNDEKQSITSDQCLPETVLLDPDTLTSLPEYQRKSTMLDTLAHAMESMWSVNSTLDSMEYSKRAIGLFKEHMEGYLNNTREGNAGMQMAAHIAGKAINITQTTAGHAMCYKITSLFGCAHGHAAMMCNRMLFPWMLDNIERSSESIGIDRLKNAFDNIAVSLNCSDPYQAVTIIEKIYDSFDLEMPRPDEDQFEMLINSVNETRLKNNPIKLDKADIEELYRRVFF